MKTKQVTVLNSTKVEHFDLGAVDEKARAIGAEITTWEVDHVEVPEDYQYGYWTTVQPGRYYVFRPWATRNGKTYGAVQNSPLFSTPEERQKAINKYLQGAKKRAAKRSVKN